MCSFTKRYNLSVSIPYFYPDLQLEKTNRGGAGGGGGGGLKQNRVDLQSKRDGDR